MRRETKAERDAWTAHVEGGEVAKASKYGNERRGKYASIHEAEVATGLAALAEYGLILDLKEQERIVLVPGNGRLRSIVYVADFTYRDAVTGKRHVIDAKGFKTQVYRLKKRAAALLLGIEIEEV
jgi:hypothetical protein